jgi:dihydropteroate synthase
MFSWSSIGGRGPAVMGIVNVTPDSFSDGGRYLEPQAAVEHGLALVEAGADVLDVGGESTRPGAVAVAADEELARVVPVIRRLAAETRVPVSVDTRKASVATAALDAGAQVVNDVSAGRADGEMLRVVAATGAGFVAMHMLGEPGTMQDAPRYDDVVLDVGDFLLERLDVARAAGIDERSLCADPGIGFGKSVAHNLELLARLDELCERVEVPVLVGPSRKRFLGIVLQGDQGGAEPPADSRDDATLAAAVWAIDRGAAIVRVHEVRSVVDAVRLHSVMQEFDAKAVA